MLLQKGADHPTRPGPGSTARIRDYLSRIFLLVFSRGFLGALYNYRLGGVYVESRSCNV